jgi:hypothetical protein
LRFHGARIDQWRAGTRVTSTPSMVCVQLDDVGRSRVAQPAAVAERRDVAWPGADARDRRGVEMIVVVVRDRHDVERRQALEWDTYPAFPLYDG